MGRAAAMATTRIEHSSSSNAERQGQGKAKSRAAQVGKRACRGRRGRKDHETVAGRWHVCEEREEAQGERESEKSRWRSRSDEAEEGDRDRRVESWASETIEFYLHSACAEARWTIEWRNSAAAGAGAAAACELEFAGS